MPWFVTEKSEPQKLNAGFETCVSLQKRPATALKCLTNDYCKERKSEKRQICAQALANAGTQKQSYKQHA